LDQTDFTNADLRNAQISSDDLPSIMRNAILPDGTVPNLTLNPGEVMKAWPNTYLASSNSFLLPPVQVVVLAIAGAQTGGVIAPTGELDLTNNDAVIKAGYTRDEIRQLLAAGNLSGHFGITSSTASSTSGIEYMLGKDYKMLNSVSSFEGVAISDGDIILE